MTQRDLFAPPHVKRVCGTCVVRNAINEEQEYGECSRMTGEQHMRHKDSPPCDAWFGLEQGRLGLYGRKSSP